MTYASDFRELAPLLMRKDGGEAANEIDEAAPTSKEAQEEADTLSSEDEDTSESKSKGSSWNPFSISLDPWADKKERDAIIDRELDSIKDFFNIFNPDNFKTKAGGGRIADDFRAIAPLLTRNKGGDTSTVKNKMNIGGEPHQLSYINSDEADILRRLGGSGRPVNGVPAYAIDADIGSGWSDPADPGVQSGVDDTAIDHLTPAERDRATALSQVAALGHLDPGGPVDPDYDYIHKFQTDPPDWWDKGESPRTPLSRAEQEQSQIASRSEGGGLSTIYKATGGRSSRYLDEYGREILLEDLEDEEFVYDPNDPYADIPDPDILGLTGFHSSYDRAPIDLAVAGLSALGFHGAGPFMAITTQHARQNYVNSIRAQYDLEPLGFFSIGMTKEEQQYPITEEELARKGQYGDLGVTTGGYGRLDREPTEQEIKDWTKPSGFWYELFGRNPYDIMMQEYQDKRDKSVREQQEAVKNRGAAASQVAAMYGATPVDPPVGPPDLIDEGVPTNVWDELAEQPIQTIIDDTFIDATTDFGDDDTSSDNDTSDDYSSWF
jgi:hypothetical protein